MFRLTDYIFKNSIMKETLKDKWRRWNRENPLDYIDWLEFKEENDAAYTNVNLDSNNITFGSW